MEATTNTTTKFTSEEAEDSEEQPELTDPELVVEQPSSATDNQSEEVAPDEIIRHPKEIMFLKRTSFATRIRLLPSRKRARDQAYGSVNYPVNCLTYGLSNVYCC